MRESYLSRTTRDYLGWLENQGFLWWTRLNSGNLFPVGKDGKKYKVQLCEPGTFDYVIVIRENLGNPHEDQVCIIFWETKATTGILSLEQWEFAKKVRAQGAICLWDITLDPLADQLQAINPAIPRPA